MSNLEESLNILIDSIGGIDKISKDVTNEKNNICRELQTVERVTKDYKLSDSNKMKLEDFHILKVILNAEYIVKTVHNNDKFSITVERK